MGGDDGLWVGPDGRESAQPPPEEITGGKKKISPGPLTFLQVLICTQELNIN